MYANEEEKKIDTERLYDQLMSAEGEFCMKLGWLAEKAMASSAYDSIGQMWSVYLSVMDKIGGELFGGDICWNSRSELIEPVFDKLTVEGYEAKIMQLIHGVYNLLGKIKTSGYYELLSDLNNISTQYYGITRRYAWGGELAAYGVAAKWEYVNQTNRFFGAAYDIAAGECERWSSKPEKSKVSLPEEIRDADDVLDGLMDGLEAQAYPVRHFFKKLFRGIKKALGINKKR